MCPQLKCSWADVVALLRAQVQLVERGEHENTLSQPSFSEAHLFTPIALAPYHAVPFFLSLGRTVVLDSANLQLPFVIICMNYH